MATTKARYATRKITYLALFTALATILASAKIMPTTSFKLAFGTVPIMYAGMFLGPLSGFFCGFVSDYFGALINSSGSAYLPTIGLAAGLVGMIAGLLYRIPRLNPYLKIVLSFVLTTLICTCFINTLTLWWTYSRASGKSFWVYLGGRVPLQLVNTVINMVLVLSLYHPLRKFVFKKPLRYKDACAAAAEPAAQTVADASSEPPQSQS